MAAVLQARLGSWSVQRLCSYIKRWEETLAEASTAAFTCRPLVLATSTAAPAPLPRHLAPQRAAIEAAKRKSVHKVGGRWWSRSSWGATKRGGTTRTPLV